MLDHLVEATFYTAKDLESISHTLDKIDGIINRARDSCSPHVLSLLEIRVCACRKVLTHLRGVIADISPELAPSYEKLISILRSIAAASTRQQVGYSRTTGCALSVHGRLTFFPQFPAREVKDFQGQLRDLDSSLKEGELSKIGASHQAGLKQIESLLLRCLNFSDIILERSVFAQPRAEQPSLILLFISRRGTIDEAFKSRYDKLRNIRNQLEKLTLLKNWALRETDLYSYQRDLDQEDTARVDGNFVDQDGNPADLFTQRVHSNPYPHIFPLLLMAMTRTLTHYDA